MAELIRLLRNRSVSLVIACVAIALSPQAWSTDPVAPIPKRDLSGGATIQRKRIETFIKNTAAMDCERALASLSEPSEDFNVAYLAGLTNLPTPPIVMRQILADRRVAKIYEELAKLPADQACEKATRAFDGKLQKHEEEFGKWCNGTSKYQLYPAFHPHAASATLFLCASFCSTETFQQKFDSWYARLGQPQFDNGGASKRCRYPDPLFAVNLLVLVAEKQGQSLEELNAKLTDTATKFDVRLPKAQELKFFRWNAHTNDTDFTHVHRGVAFDPTAIMTEVTGFASHPPSAFGSDAERTQQVIDG